MSVLLIEPPRGPGEAAVRLLFVEDDEVRVLLRDGSEAPHWRSLGAFVATGDPDDEDLVERACQNVRTVVIFGPPTAALVTGASAANVSRLVSVTSRAVARVPHPEHVRLVTKARRGLLKSRCRDEDLAVAISAADDLASVPVEPVYLTDPEGWSALKLEAR